MTLSGIGDFLMDLWIMTAEDKVVVKPPKVQVTNTGSAISRNVSNPIPAGTEYTMKQMENSSDATDAILQGYNIYENGANIGYVAVPNTEYDVMDLDPGTYEYCVSAVYDEGESILVCAEPPIVIEDPVPPGPINLVGPAAVTVPEPVYLTWEAPGQPQWIRWDAGTNTGNGIGLTNGGTFSCASHWYPPARRLQWIRSFGS
jgi:hypothetical protein